MYKFYKPLHELEILDRELISNVYWSIENCKNIFYDPKHNWYQQFLVHDTISDFTKKIFDFEHYTTIQIIKPGLPIHIDFGRKTAYNFIIETGGSNVLTCFYDAKNFYYDSNNKLRPSSTPELLEQVCIPKMMWHQINVSVPHNVINVENVRISITVAEINK